MIIQEIFIQGIKGLGRQVASKPLSMAVASDMIARPTVLDEGVEPQSVFDCLSSLIYPSEITMVAEDMILNGENPQLGIRFSLDGNNFRSIRTGTGDSIVMQVEEVANGRRGWKTVASGAMQIDNLFNTKLHRPPYEFFQAASAWCDPDLFFKYSDAEEAIEEAIDNDLSINSLMIMYENAYSYEQAQAQVGKLSQKLAQRGGSPPPKIDPQLEINARQKAAIESSINEKLIEIGQLGLGDVSQSEYEDVLEAESKVESLGRDLMRLREQKRHLESGIFAEELKPWPSNPVFWLCLILGLACFVAPFFLPAEVVFLALLFVGISFFILVKSVRAINKQANLLKQLVRVEERIDKEADAFALAKQKIQHFMLSVDCISVAQAGAKFAERQKLVNQLAARQVELQEFLEEVGKDGLPVEEYPVQQRNPNATLIGELAIARQALENTEKPAYSTRAIAKEIVKHGLDPEQFPVNEPDLDSLKKHESILINQAFNCHMFEPNGLREDVEELWNELLHRFMHKSLHFCINGRSIEISQEKSSKPSSPNWKNERPNVYRWVLFSFACALVEYSARTKEYPDIPHSIFTIHPSLLDRKDDQRRLERIISGTKAASWILFGHE